MSSAQTGLIPASSTKKISAGAVAKLLIFYLLLLFAYPFELV
jgi:hypothetical protein